LPPDSKTEISKIQAGIKLKPDNLELI